MMHSMESDQLRKVLKKAFYTPLKVTSQRTAPNPCLKQADLNETTTSKTMVIKNKQQFLTKNIVA